jgi:adenylylsulfate kinase
LLPKPERSSPREESTWLYWSHMNFGKYSLLNRGMTRTNEMLSIGRMVYVGVLLTRHGVPVIFDATANRRNYREMARQQIPNFVEAYVDSPLETCVARDTKGIYRQARHGGTATVPGLQTEYEAPEHAELVVHGDRESPGSAANRLIAALIERGYVK